MRTGDEAEARVVLERAWSVDSSNRTTKNLLDMLDKLEPTQLWGLASAGWKPEDVDAWSRRLGFQGKVVLHPRQLPIAAAA